MQLQVDQITKTFGEKLVLDGVSFEAQSGKALGLLGRNGAGKTTTIRIIMQVFDPDAGNVFLDGKPLDVAKTSIGYLPEERGMYPKKPILDQLVYFGALRGMKPKEAKKSALALLERLEMGQYADKKLDTLSKGNQQKIQLAVTLLDEPDIVILDEPFSGLDPVNAMLLKEIVKEQMAKGKVIVFSSHQMNYIEEFCNDIVILNRGKVALAGDIGQIKRGYDRTTMLVESLYAEKVGALATGAHEMVKEVHVQGNTARITLAGAEDKGRLLEALAREKIDIDRFAVYEPSLNDIFVEYTEGAV